MPIWKPLCKSRPSGKGLCQCPVSKVPHEKTSPFRRFTNRFLGWNFICGVSFLRISSGWWTFNVGTSPNYTGIWNIFVFHSRKPLTLSADWCNWWMAGVDIFQHHQTEGGVREWVGWSSHWIGLVCFLSSFSFSLKLAFFAPGNGWVGKMGLSFKGALNGLFSGASSLAVSFSGSISPLRARFGGFKYIYIYIFLFSSRSLGIWLVVSNIFYFHPGPWGSGWWFRIFSIFIPVPGDLVGGFEYFLFSSRSLGIWLVVSNIFYFHPGPWGSGWWFRIFSIFIPIPGEIDSQIWRLHIFSKGLVETTNQYRLGTTSFTHFFPYG